MAPLLGHSCKNGGTVTGKGNNYRILLKQAEHFRLGNPTYRRDYWTNGSYSCLPRSSYIWRKSLTGLRKGWTMKATVIAILALAQYAACICPYQLSLPGIPYLPPGYFPALAAYPPYFLPFPQCITHRVERTVKPVVDECVQHVPIVKRRLRTQAESVTRHIPVLDKIYTHQEEKYIRHVPVLQRYCKPVIETRTTHIPVLKRRFRTVIEPYTAHIPILEKYTRPVEDTYVKNIPIVQTACRPIIRHTVRHVPITERRLKPFIEQTLIQLPIKQRFLKNYIEQRVRAVKGPCSSCLPFAPAPLPSTLPFPLHPGLPFSFLPYPFPPPAPPFPLFPGSAPLPCGC